MDASLPIRNHYVLGPFDIGADRANLSASQWFWNVRTQVYLFGTIMYRARSISVLTAPTFLLANGFETYGR